MAYTIYHADSALGPVTVPDNSIDTEFYIGTVPGSVGQIGSGLLLVGRNAINYGASIAQNFLQLTENFASTNAPGTSGSLQGQLWFNKTNNALYVKSTVGASPYINNWHKLVAEDADGDITVTGKFAGSGAGLTNLPSSSIVGTVAVSANIAGGLIGYVPYQSAANTTTLLPSGPAGHVLTSNGSAAPSWEATVALSATPFINPASGAEKVGDIKVVGSVISIYAAGTWKQIFPAVYS
jgi:hypothetical protein